MKRQKWELYELSSL